MEVMVTNHDDDDEEEDDEDDDEYTYLYSPVSNIVYKCLSSKD